MANNEGTPLHGDRSVWNVADHGNEHASDINGSSYKHHVPAPSTSGNFARSDGSKWVSEAVSIIAGSGSGAAGRIAFWSNASTLTSDNDLVFDSTNTRFGLGLAGASPETTIHMLGDSVMMDRYGGSPTVIQRRANGSAGSLTAPVANDQLGGFVVRPYNGSAYVSSALAAIAFFALDNHSTTAGGTYFTIRTTNSGNITSAERMRIGDSGFTSFIAQDDNNNSVSAPLTLRYRSNLTPQAGFGAAMAFQLESSTTNDQDAVSLQALWSTATHASRSADFVVQTVNNAGGLTERWRIRSTGAINHTAITAPGSLNESDQWNDSTQKTHMSYSAGIKQSRVGCVYTATADATVANTTTETSIIGTGVGTKTLPANLFVAGKTVRVRVRGILSDTGTPTLNIKVKLGSTIIVQTTAIALSGTITNNYFEAEADITCRTTGATGTVEAAGQFVYDNTTQSGKVEGMANTGTVTIDTTASQAVDITATWGTASSSNTISGQLCSIEILN